jgi:Sec-independent protein translocase protein TatA
LLPRRDWHLGIWDLDLGILEIFLVLLVALVVIPPDDLPQVMRAAGRILRELRLASNTVMREIGGALDEPPAHLMQQRTTPPEQHSATSEPGDAPPEQRATPPEQHTAPAEQGSASPEPSAAPPDSPAKT